MKTRHKQSQPINNNEFGDLGHNIEVVDCQGKRKRTPHYTFEIKDKP